uniref:ShKT domain-containing protein n=1 Tax=Parastrongyloides trichosuri TaxID=131310 RepID=A0A0N4Z1N6_PARTI
MDFSLIKLIVLFSFASTVLSEKCETLALSGKCSNPIYREKMCLMCEKECNETKSPCIKPTKDNNCKDEAIDCDKKIFLCNEEKFKEIMLKNCPSTCGNCGNGNGTTTMNNKSTTKIQSTSKITTTKGVTTKKQKAF